MNDLFVDGHEIVFRAHLRWCVSLLDKHNRDSELDDIQVLKALFGAVVQWLAHTHSRYFEQYWRSCHLFLHRFNKVKCPQVYLKNTLRLWPCITSQAMMQIQKKQIQIYPFNKTRRLWRHLNKLKISNLIFSVHMGDSRSNLACNTPWSHFITPYKLSI